MENPLARLVKKFVLILKWSPNVNTAINVSTDSNIRSAFNMRLAIKSTLLFLSVLLFVPQLSAAKKFTLSPKVGQQVSTVFELYELGKLEQALIRVNRIKARSPFDKAYVNRFKGNLYWETGDEDKALQALEIAVAEHALAEKEQMQSQRMLADLYLNKKQTDKAIAVYQSLLKKQPSEDLYKHLAIAYYQKKSWNQLVDATHNAINLKTGFNQSVHILQLSALYELKDYRNATKTLLKLTKHDPSTKRWWMQLASSYRLLKQDKKALATYELAYQQGLMDSSSDILQLANFRASLGAPYRAALLLESALNTKKVTVNANNYKQLAMFWQVAREHDKAQQYWGKSADLSGEVLHYVTQAQLLHLLGRYDKMLQVLLPIKSDNAELQGKVKLTQVQALFSLKKYQQAQDIAHQQVENPSSKKRALQWVKLLENRRNAMQEFAMQ